MQKHFSVIPKTARNISLQRTFARLYDGLQYLFIRTPYATIKPKATLQADDNDFRQLAFTFALIGLSVNLVKIRGHVTRAEYLAFREIFPLSDEASPKIRKLFALAWKDSAPAKAYARQVVYLYPERPKLYLTILKRLCLLSCASSMPGKAELQLLHEIASIFAISRRTLRIMLHECLSQSLPNPYEVLGLAANATPEQVKQRYRELMRKYHPDKIMARAHFPETLAIAMMRSASINEAYHFLSKKVAA